MTEQKNIIFINPGQFGYKAGYYYYSKYLANDKRFNISFLCFDQNLPKLEIDGVKVKYIDFLGNIITRHFRWLKAVYSIMKHNKTRSTIFFMVYFKLCFIYTLLFPKKLIVLDIRTGSISNNSIKNWLQNLQYRFESLFFKHITILSKGLIKHIGINPQKCHWLPLGAEIFSNQNKNFNSINLIYVGTLNGRRIHETIDGLDIFIKYYNSEKINISYDIFGFGSEKEEEIIKQKIVNYKFQNTVKFHGRKNHIELKYFFDKCNIGVAYVPQTKYYEYQPSTKIFEYIFSGMVCIATNIFENRILITNENGVICNDDKDGFANAIKEIQNKMHEYSSQNIRSTLNSYSWNNIIKKKLIPFFLKIK